MQHSVEANNPDALQLLANYRADPNIVNTVNIAYALFNPCYCLRDLFILFIYLFIYSFIHVCSLERQHCTSPQAIRVSSNVWSFSSTALQTRMSISQIRYVGNISFLNFILFFVAKKLCHCCCLLIFVFGCWHFFLLLVSFEAIKTVFFFPSRPVWRHPPALRGRVWKRRRDWDSHQAWCQSQCRKYGLFVVFCDLGEKPCYSSSFFFFHSFILFLFLFSFFQKKKAGNTSLHAAALSTDCSVQLISLLIENGADPTVTQNVSGIVFFFFFFFKKNKNLYFKIYRFTRLVF